MLNQVVIVGRITGKMEYKLGGNKLEFTLAVPRSFKNSDGEYDTDYINVSTFGGVGESMFKNCKEGDIVGVKGRLQLKTIEKYHTKINTVEVIAEKITFLNNHRGDEE